ncbi:hypothetical protein GT350_18795, partial [Streptomyces sp. SID1034]|nr:hypothetical protein [Streptomyces sp. SID1034]
MHHTLARARRTFVAAGIVAACAIVPTAQLASATTHSTGNAGRTAAAAGGCDVLAPGASAAAE